MKIATAVSVLLLVGLALAGQQTYDILFLNGSRTMAIPSTAACTTKWYGCERGREQTLYWQEWVNVGASDSARLKIDFQIAVKDTAKRVSATDTLISLAVCGVLDTTGAPRCHIRTYYPDMCLRIRYIITALSGSSDSANVGNVILQLDDRQ